MSVSSEISRLNGLRTSIRTKLISLGVLSSSATSADLEDCKDAIDTISKKSSSDLTILNGTVSVPAGYYSDVATLQLPLYTGGIS